MIFYDFKADLTARKSYAGFSLFLLVKHYGRRLFIFGALSSNLVAVNNYNIHAVYEMIDADRHIIYHEFHAVLDIGISEIQQILAQLFERKKTVRAVNLAQFVWGSKNARVNWYKAILKRSKNK